MSIVKRFVWAEWEDIGTWGWQMKGMPHFDPGTGLTVAHDCIEHFKPTGNNLKDEWLAFGHILWLRAGGDYWHQIGNHNPDPAYQLSGDIARFINESDEHVPMIRTQRLEDWVETILDGALNRARRELIDDYERDDCDDALTAARGWIRRGFRRAEKLYGNLYPCDVCDWFIRLERRVDDLSKCLGESESAGTELIVRLDRRSLSFDIETRVPGWDY